MPLIVNFLSRCQIRITADLRNDEASFPAIPFIRPHSLFREKLLDKSGMSDSNIMNGSRNSTIDPHDAAGMRMDGNLIFQHTSLMLRTPVIFFVLGWFPNGTGCYIEIAGAISE